MILARREFLRLLGLSAGAGLAGCRESVRVPRRMVERALAGPGIESWSPAVCGLCEGGCGVSVRLVDGLPVGIKGNPSHPLNRGGLCPVGQSALELLYAPERLSGPLHKQADGSQLPASWEPTLAELAARLGELRDQGRGNAIAFLSGEPDGLFGDLLERFARALGAQQFAFGRPSALPFYLTQGTRQVPGFDFAGTDFVLAFGVDLYGEGAAPIHQVAALVGTREDGERARSIQVGTRYSLGAARAEERITVLPGTHGAFALGVANVLVREGRYDAGFVERHTAGFEDWTDAGGARRDGFRRLLLERYYPDRAARLCGASPAALVRTARRFARSRAPLAIAGSEVTQGSNATWSVMAVHALNALMGSFWREGGVGLPPQIPLTPLEPLPNEASTQGGDDPDLRPFGRDPVEHLIERAESGQVELLLVMGADPVHDHPLGGRLREALGAVPLVVAVTPFLDETAAVADRVLPCPLYLESWYSMTTPPGTAMATLGLAPPAIEPLADSVHPGDLLLRLARGLGAPVADALPWSEWPVYLRHRIDGLARSGVGAAISGSFEESWVRFLEERGWRFDEAEAGSDLWKELTRRGGWWNPAPGRQSQARLFSTPSGRFEFAPDALARALGEEEDAAGCMPHFEPPETAGGGELLLQPYRPLTARGRWAAASPAVLEMFAYPVLSGWETSVEIAPETAHELDLGDGDLVRVESDRGAVESVVRVAAGSAPGVAHMPVGLGHQRAALAGTGVGVNPLELTLPVRDTLAGTAAAGATRVRLHLVRRRPLGGPAPHGEGEA